MNNSLLILGTSRGDLWSSEKLDQDSMTLIYDQELFY